MCGSCGFGYTLVSLLFPQTWATHLYRVRRRRASLVVVTFYLDLLTFRAHIKGNRIRGRGTAPPPLRGAGAGEIEGPYTFEHGALGLRALAVYLKGSTPHILHVFYRHRVVALSLLSALIWGSWGVFRAILVAGNTEKGEYRVFPVVNRRV